MSKGSFSVGGKQYTWQNNPQSGKLDIYDEDGEHIGEAPNADEAEKFIKKQHAAGRLSDAPNPEVVKQMAAGLNPEHWIGRIKEIAAQADKTDDWRALERIAERLEGIVGSLQIGPYSGSPEIDQVAAEMKKHRDPIREKAKALQKEAYAKQDSGRKLARGDEFFVKKGAKLSAAKRLMTRDEESEDLWDLYERDKIPPGEIIKYAKQLKTKAEAAGDKEIVEQMNRLLRNLGALSAGDTTDETTVAPPKAKTPQEMEQDPENAVNAEVAKEMSADAEITKATKELAVKWIEPHKNQSQIKHKAHTITVAQKESDGTWSWEVAGEDNGGVRSREEAIRQAKDMVDSITKDWD